MDKIILPNPGGLPVLAQPSSSLVASPGLCCWAASQLASDNRLKSREEGVTFTLNKLKQDPKLPKFQPQDFTK